MCVHPLCAGSAGGLAEGKPWVSFVDSLSRRRPWRSQARRDGQDAGAGRLAWVARRARQESRQRPPMAAAKKPSAGRRAPEIARAPAGSVPGSSCARLSGADSYTASGFLPTASAARATGFDGGRCLEACCPPVQALAHPQHSEGGRQLCFQAVPCHEPSARHDRIAAAAHPAARAAGDSPRAPAVHSSQTAWQPSPSSPAVRQRARQRRHGHHRWTRPSP